MIERNLIPRRRVAAKTRPGRKTLIFITKTPKVADLKAVHA